MPRFYLSVKLLSVFFIVMFVFSLPSNASEKDELMMSVPSLEESLRFSEPFFFCENRLPLEIFYVRERFEKEFLLALGDRPQVILWLKRAGRYFPHIESVLKKEGLPDDLKYLAVVESGLRPHAGSYMGAIGFWQFMRSTGKGNGLRIDSRIDERRNLFKSTAAACQHLKKLKDMFDSWPLAAAAYNMGENGLASEMKLQGATDYYSLYLPLETQSYVLKIIVAKTIMKNAKKYGFCLTPDELYPELTFDRVKINSSSEIPLAVIAKSALVSFKEIKDLNPEIRGHFLPRGKNSILIPKGRAKGFEQKFSELLTLWKKENGSRFHVVKTGENLTTIAKRYEMPLDSLLQLNKLTTKSFIHPGDRLMVEAK